MPASPESPRLAFTRGEIRAFQIHAVVLAAVVGGLAVFAPRGIGQTLGVLGAVALLPVPPLVVYWRRRRNLTR